MKKLTQVFILDTDYVSLVLRGDSQAKLAIEKRGGTLCTSIITAQELFNGWVARINNAKPLDDFVALYAEFYRSINYLKKTDILPFNNDADLCFRQLLQANPSLRKARLVRDMRIAAIALSLNATVVTRNRRDFEQVPGLKIEDWTV
jgi:tRNA(fMet)-specific endonuclease VapC